MYWLTLTLRRKFWLLQMSLNTQLLSFCFNLVKQQQKNKTSEDLLLFTQENILRWREDMMHMIWNCLLLERHFKSEDTIWKIVIFQFTFRQIITIYIISSRQSHWMHNKLNEQKNWQHSISQSNTSSIDRTQSMCHSEEKTTDHQTTRRHQLNCFLSCSKSWTRVCERSICTRVSISCVKSRLMRQRSQNIWSQDCWLWRQSVRRLLVEQVQSLSYVKS